jgi:hypothetical protein
VDEYHLHRLACPDCGETTGGILPEGVPTAGFGLSLQATLATLAGAYRLSKRPIPQLASDLFGLSISSGTESARGSRFEERMLTVVATCRQQGRNVLDYLRSCFEAARSGQAPPPSCRRLNRRSKSPDPGYPTL